MKPLGFKLETKERRYIFNKMKETKAHGKYYHVPVALYQDAELFFDNQRRPAPEYEVLHDISYIIECVMCDDRITIHKIKKLNKSAGYLSYYLKKFKSENFPNGGSSSNVKKP